MTEKALRARVVLLETKNLARHRAHSTCIINRLRRAVNERRLDIMEVYGVIYLLIDGINDMEYVGQTTRSVEERFNEHKKRKKYLISKAIRAHGAENFAIAILKECANKEELDFWEKHFIKSRNTLSPNGYNLTEGGEGGIPCAEVYAKISAAKKGHEVSKETRAKLAAVNIGKSQTPEAREKNAEAHRGEKNNFFGKHHTEETKAKISEKKKNPSAETRAKLSAINKGRRHTAEARAKMSATRKGKKRQSHTEEAKLKMSVARRGESPYKNLLAEMDTRQISYAALAKILDLTVATVSAKMRGKVKFMVKDIAKLVEFFGKPVEYLMTRDDGEIFSVCKGYNSPFKNLVATIVEHQLTYKSLVEPLGLSTSSVSCKMRGEKNFTPEEMITIKNFLGVEMSVEELFKRFDD